MCHLLCVCTMCAKTNFLVVEDGVGAPCWFVWLSGGVLCFSMLCGCLRSGRSTKCWPWNPCPHRASLANASTTPASDDTQALGKQLRKVNCLAGNLAPLCHCHRSLLQWATRWQCSAGPDAHSLRKQSWVLPANKKCSKFTWSGKQMKNGCQNQASKQLTPNERNKTAETTSKTQTVAYLQA